MKIDKIKIIIFVISLSSLCFGENIKDKAYDNLLGAVEMGKFAKFKNLHLESKVTVGQKKDLLAMANKIIEREKTNWPKSILGKTHGFWGDISMAKGREIKKKIKINCGIMLLSMMGVYTGTGYCIIHLNGSNLINIKSLLNALKALKDGNVAIPSGSSAAVIGLNWNLQKKQFILKVIPPVCALYVIVGLSSFCIGFTQGKMLRILSSYKLFKGATKIKQLLQQSMPNVSLEDAKIQEV